MSKIVNIKPFIILMILFSVALIAYVYGIYINVTPSMKQGIYRSVQSNIHRGDIVAFCLEEPYKSIGLKNGYLEKGTVCRGADPLIKQVIAVPGDNVQLADQSIAVNAVVYPYQTFHIDSSQRTLAVYPRGTYHAQGYWLIGTHSIYSWDSRYFGEIRPHQILCKLKPLFTWE